MDELIRKLRPLVAQIMALQAQASAIGLFANDRELLECPGCGLKEDVACDGRLITYRGTAFGEDLGLRFEELADPGFRCPTCSQLVHERLAEDEDSEDHADRGLHKRRRRSAARTLRSLEAIRFIFPPYANRAAPQCEPRICSAESKYIHHQGYLHPTPTARRANTNRRRSGATIECGRGVGSSGLGQSSASRPSPSVHPAEGIHRRTDRRCHLSP